MLIYILKFSACLALLLLFYKLFLERESMHVFKRFYLLGALLFSLIVPLVIFSKYVEVQPSPEVVYLPATQTPATDVINVPPALENDVFDIAPLLWGVYFLGLFFFALNFIKNLVRIALRIRKNPKQKIVPFIRVLLRENYPPHTFFKYIFLNKNKLDANEIPREVLLHEETHAKQKHSIDVLFVELLQVLFWFNPLIYIMRKSIKLNHEFLADSEVLKNGADSSTYQNTLLSFMIPKSQNQPVANAINYSSIKKRFTVMKTRTSKKAVLLRGLLLLPLLALLLYGFSQRTIEEKKSTNTETTIINDINVEIDSNGDLLINEQSVLISDIFKEIDKLNSNLEPYYIRNYVTANILYDESHVDLIATVQAELQHAGIKNIEHTSKRTTAILGREDFRASPYHGKTLDEATALRRERVLNEIIEDDKDLLEIVWIDIKNETEIWFKDELITLEDLALRISATEEIASGENKFIAQIYSTGILRSDFVDKITHEVRKAGAKQIQVITEQYIIPENEYQDDIDTDANPVILKANRITFSGSEKKNQSQIGEKNKIPTAKDFEKWKNKNEYAIWIHEKPVDNSVLSKYKPSDFVHYFLSFVHKNARSERFSQPYQLHLYTQNEFEKYVVKDDWMIEILINKNGQLLVQSKLVELNDLASYLMKLNKHLSKEERQKTIRAVIISDKFAPKDVIADIEEILDEYGVAQIDIRGSENMPPPAQNGATQKQLSKYNTLAKKYNAQPKAKRVIPSEDLKSLETIYRKMSEKQKTDARPFPECPDSKSNNQERATEKQIGEYNALAKKYNTLLADNGNIRIKKSDIDRLEYINGIMTEDQRANAEPFPDFPEPPAPPAPPSSPDLSEKEFADEVIEYIIANQDPRDGLNINVNYSSYPREESSIDKYTRQPKQGTYSKIDLNEPAKPVSSQNRVNTKSTFNYPYDPANNNAVENDFAIPPAPPAPPKPKSPIDHVIEMAKKDARFYYEGKEISSDKAIDLMKKKNKNLNIDSKTEKGKRPVVKLSTEPFVAG